MSNCEFEPPGSSVGREIQLPPARPPWRPTRVNQLVRSLGTSSKPVIVETDAGRAVIKALGNGDDPVRLALELLGTEVADLLGVPTFEYGVMPLSALDAGIVRFDNGASAEAGPAFVTRYEVGASWGGGEGELCSAENLHVLPAIVVLDTWIRNWDRCARSHDRRVTRSNPQNLFLSTERVRNPDSVRIVAFDHAHAFGSSRGLRCDLAGIDSVREEIVYGMFPAFQPHFRGDDIDAALGRLGDLDAEHLVGLVDRIPTEWVNGSGTRESLRNFVVDRRRFLLEHFRRILDGLVDVPSGGYLGFTMESPS